MPSVVSDLRNMFAYAYVEISALYSYG